MIEHMTDPSKQVVRIQHPIGQVLRSRCHLYFFSFPPRTRLCPLTRGGTARLLGLGPFSLQLEKGSSRGPRRAAFTCPRSLGTGCSRYFSFLQRFSHSNFSRQKKGAFEPWLKDALVFMLAFYTRKFPLSSPFLPGKGTGWRKFPLDRGPSLWYYEYILKECIGKGGFHGAE